MNEQVARDVILVRAIETADRKCEILSEDDRMYASRSARELAQWQASENKTAVTADHFLQQRSEQIIKRLGERTPAFASFIKQRAGLKQLSVALPVVALILGAGLDRITDPHRVDLLSAPLLLIIGWNLVVYLMLLVWLLFPSRSIGWASAAMLARLSGAKAGLPRKLPHTLAAAMTDFMAEWTRLSARLTRARLSRTVHLSAAAFAMGAVLSLYARGLLAQYAAGWESTFLDARQVHAILSTVFAPAEFVFRMQGFSIADVEALRFTPTQSPVGGARWVHLYAATMLLLVMLPRLVLAGIAHWQARRLANNFPLDLGEPYFRKLGDKTVAGEPGVLRVLPYSFTLDEARHTGLQAVAAMLLGEQARVMLRPSSAYGEDALTQLADARLDAPTVNATAVLFNLAATPEKENHGAFLDHLRRANVPRLSALIDESSLLERLGPQVTERIALWQQFCAYHKVPASIVNLLHPETRPLA